MQKTKSIVYIVHTTVLELVLLCVGGGREGEGERGELGYRLPGNLLHSDQSPQEANGDTLLPRE